MTAEKSMLKGKILQNISLSVKIRNTRKDFKRLGLALQGFDAVYFTPQKPTRKKDLFTWVKISISFIGKMVGAEKGVEIGNRITWAIYMVFTHHRYIPWRTWGNDNRH